jgi:hypothetical protein
MQLKWSGNNFSESFSLNSPDGSSQATYSASGTASDLSITYLHAKTDTKTTDSVNGQVLDTTEEIDEIELQNVPSVPSDDPQQIVSFDYRGPDFSSTVLTAKRTVIYTDKNGTTTTVYSFTSFQDVSASFENYYGLTGPGGDLAITGISLVQVIHGWPELPLIAGKKTVARVFIKSVGPNATTVDGVSAVLHGPGTPEPLPIEAPIVAQPYNGPVPSTDPPNFNDGTVDFVLPDAWVAGQGQLTLTADIVLPPGFQDSNPANNELQRTVTLMPPPQNPQSASPPGVFRVGYVLCITEDSDGHLHEPDFIDPGAIGAFIQKIYPIPEGGLTVSKVGTLPLRYDGQVETSAQWDGLLEKALRGRYANADYDQVVVFVWLDPLSKLDGDSDPVWANGQGKVVLVAESSRTPETVAHEIGHNLGLRHAVPANPALGCGTGDPCQPRFWPYTDPTIQLPGFDPWTKDLVPNTFFDLMSYCVNSTATNAWISPDYFNTLINNNLAPSDAPCPPPTNAPSLAPLTGTAKLRPRQKLAVAQDLLLVAGSVGADGQSGQLDPVFHLTSTAAPPVSDPNGSYCLHFTGGAGLPGDFCFTPMFLDGESNPLNTQSFSFLLPAAAGVTGLQLLAGGNPLASISGGAQPPTLSITAPNSGDTWSSPQNLTWNGSSSGSLTYIVDYSSDGGATWIPLSLPMTDSSLAIDPAGLVGPAVYFRVQASDGFFTTMAQAGPVQLVQTPHIAATPATLDFRNGLPGISVERDLVLTNPGSGPLQVTKVAFDNAAFSLLSPKVPFTVFSGDQLTLQVMFTAPAAGPAQGNMTISSNDAATQSLMIPLSGTGISSVAPDAAVGAASVDFGQVAVGSTGTQTVNVRNFGPGQLTVNAVSVSGAGFALAAGLAQTPIALGVEMLAIGVQFTPTQTGAQIGSLTIATSDPANASLMVSLRGTGTNGASSCTYALAAGTPNPPSFSSAGGSGTATVTAGTGCAWSASSASTWLTTSSSGSGNGTVNYAVAVNTSTSARTSTLTVAGQTLTVTQAAGGIVSIAITNPGFETIPANVQWISCAGNGGPGSGGPGCQDTTDDNIPGWTAVGSGIIGLFQPGPNYFTLPLPAAEGQTIAQVNTGSISQTLSATLQVNTLYTLQVDLGRRLDNVYPSPPPTMQLFAGNTLIASAGGAQPPLGGWATWTGTYQSGASDPLAGQALKIVLASTAPQGDFDNVRLTAAPSPGGAVGTTNVALNKPVTVSSQYPTYQGTPSTITDGTFTKAWFAYQGAPSYCSIVVDLGQTYSIGRIEAGPQQTMDYQIYGSTDGTNYSQIASQTWPVFISTPVSVVLNGSASARYIKYVGHTTWAQYVGLSGLRVYEWLATPPASPPASASGTTDLAKGKSVQNAQGYTSDANNPPSNVNDGSLSTAWYGTNGTYTGSPFNFYITAGMVMIDLGQSTMLGKIVITPAKAQAFGVFLTPDNTLNTPVFLFSSYQSLFDTANFSTVPQTYYLDGQVSARYVWLATWNNTPGNTAAYPGIDEIEVYGFNQ